MIPAPRTTSRPPARAAVLIITMLLLVIITSIALLVARTTRVEASAGANYATQLQCEAIADGAITYLRSVLRGTQGVVPQDTDFLNQAVPIGSPEPVGYFWCLKHDPTVDNVYQFGFTDEAGKINLNTANQAMLTRIPVPDLLTNPEIAAAIVSWRTRFGSPVPGGIDPSYYLGLPTPYSSKGANFETIEELLMVKGITPAILYGEDSNRNGFLDPNEDDSDASEPADNSDGKLDRGLADYATVYSGEPNDNDSKNAARLNVITARAGLIRELTNDKLSTSEAQLIFTKTATLLPTATLGDFLKTAAVTADEFRKIADRLTTPASGFKDPRTGLILGRININTAPRDVLACLPNMTEGDADNIVNHRASALFTSRAELIDVLALDKAISIVGSVTTKSYRVSADVIAVDATGRSFKRLWCVFDTRSTPVRLIYYRDMTNLGWPLDRGILDALRAGQYVAPIQSAPTPNPNNTTGTGAR